MELTGNKKTSRQLTAYEAVKLLVEAGEAGLTTTEIVVQFTLPESHQQRSNRVSQIMRAMLLKNYVTQGDMERTKLRNGAPVRRWFATPEATAYLAHGDAEERDRKRIARLAEWRALTEVMQQRRQAALARVSEELAAEIAAERLTRCWRYAKIMELRQVPCTLQEIAEVFHLTRERIRQIEAGREEPCRCAACQQMTQAVLGNRAARA